MVEVLLEILCTFLDEQGFYRASGTIELDRDLDGDSDKGQCAMAH